VTPNGTAEIAATDSGPVSTRAPRARSSGSHADPSRPGRAAVSAWA
jgi:hypothetical protein